MRAGQFVVVCLQAETNHEFMVLKNVGTARARFPSRIDGMLEVAEFSVQLRKPKPLGRRRRIDVDDIRPRIDCVVGPPGRVQQLTEKLVVLRCVRRASDGFPEIFLGT